MPFTDFVVQINSTHGFYCKDTYICSNCDEHTLAFGSEILKLLEVVHPERPTEMFLQKHVLVCIGQKSIFIQLVHKPNTIDPLGFYSRSGCA